MNESETAIMSGRRRDDLTIAQEFLNLGVANVVISLGAKGAFYTNAQGYGHCPAYDVKVEDTTGAGSTVIRANKAAAITIQSLGAQNGIPWSDEIERFDAPRKGPE
ncbi:unnamed protein product [Fusarium graminearum]|nr:unnamed protein product [Fusarium graminearum]